MPFTTVGIQDNLPVLPVHVLQIIQSLTQFDATYSTVDFYRQGRTNFGASTFTSSAHVEMHSYNGTDPLVIYSGTADGTMVAKVDMDGTTTLTSLTASVATLTTASLVSASITSASIANSALASTTISSAIVTNEIVANSAITTLNATTAAAVRFTASNASVTNNLTASNVLASTLTSPAANLTGSLQGTASYADASTSASYAASASYAGVAATASYVTSSNLVGTVTSASYALTASHALTSAASSPGGGNLAVQLNNANASFTGSQNLVWDTNNSFLVNKGYYVIDYATNSGGGLVSRTGTPLTNSFQIAFSNQAQYGGTLNAFDGRQLAFYDFQAGGVSAYRAGMNASGDFYIGNSSTDYSAKFQQPTQSTNVPLTLKGASGQTADIFKVTNNSDVAVLYVSASGVTSGSFLGNLTGTASYTPITAGPGITINGLSITASVRSVNGAFPAADGNVQVALSSTKTGTSASLQASASGNITGSIVDGLVWIISNNVDDATKNGDVYIYSSGSVGQWYQIEAPGASANDTTYLRLDGTNTVTANLNFGGYNVTNAGFWSGSAATASFVTASNVRGPLGVNSVVSASHAVSASHFIGTIATFPFSGSAVITGSLLVSGSGLIVTGSTDTTTNAYTDQFSYARYFQPYGFYGTTPIKPVDPAVTASAVPSYWGSGTGAGSGVGGPGRVFFGDQNIGQVGLLDADTSNPWAGAIKLIRNATTTNISVGKVPYHTLITDNATLIDNNATLALAQTNGRTHVFTVTGSMLARDGVSLGTNLTNSHIISGSVQITGSMGLAGSLITTAGSNVINPNKGVFNRLHTGTIYPIESPGLQTVNYNNGGNITPVGGDSYYYQGLFPQISPYSDGSSTNSSGNNYIQIAMGHLGIGNYAADDLNGTPRKLEAIFLHTTQLTAANPFNFSALATSAVRTIISDNNTLLASTNNATKIGIMTANNRVHTLTVTGSMLARDGVSLGTNIANSHIVTGSVNMTGSFVLNGTNLATLVSPVQSVTVDITANQILNLGTTPVTLIPAPSIGKYISVVQTTVYYKYGSQPYTTNTEINVVNGTYILQSSTLLSRTSDYVVVAPGSTGTQTGLTNNNGTFASGFLNASVYMNAPSGINPTGGNGTMRVRVLYTIEDAP